MTYQPKYDKSTQITDTFHTILAFIHIQPQLKSTHSKVGSQSQTSG